MSWITRDFRCDDCGTVTDMVLERSQDHEDARIDCDCGGSARRTVSAPNRFKASHPDGNGRFDKVREATKLRRARSDARAAGDTVTEKKLNAEIKKV